MSLLSFFQTIFNTNSEEVQKQVQLNNIYKIFKPAKEHYITKDKTLTQLFVTKLWNLYSGLTVTKQVLEQTIFNENQNKAISHTIAVAGTFLPKEMLATAETFNEEVMYQRIVDSDNQSKMLKIIDSEFNSYRNNYNHHNLPNFEMTYNFLLNIHNLQCFDFEDLFRRFDRTFNGNQTTAPIYNPVLATQVSENLQDLYYLIAVIITTSPKFDLTPMMKAIYNRISENDTRLVVKNAVNSINQVYKILEDELSVTKMLAMCKYVTNNVNLKIPIAATQSNITDKIRKHLDNQYKVIRDKVVRDISDNSMEEDINELFQRIPLDKLDGIDSELNTKLAQLGYETLNYLQHLRITKTFINRIYEPSIKSSINTLFIEGFFPEKEYQNKLSESFYRLNELHETFSEEEKKMYQGTYSTESIETFLLKSKNQKNPSINKIVLMLNAKNFKIIAMAHREFLEFGTHLLEILKDYKKPKGTIVSNIKQIKGVQNKQYITGLVNNYNAITKFCKITKQFVKKSEE